MDQRNVQYASQLVRYCREVKPGEIVLVDTRESTPVELVQAIMAEVFAVGGFPYPLRRNERLVRETLKWANKDLFSFMAACDLQLIQQSQHCIRFRDFENIFSLCDLPASQMKLFNEFYNKPVLGEITTHDNWTLTRYPTPGMAQLFNMSFEQLEDFYFQTVLLDYSKMAKAVQPLKELMQRTKMVRITGPGTDLAFSIEGIGVIECVGKINIPDGECFTAPVRNSINGTLHYNTRTVSKSGKVFEGVWFEFIEGKIVASGCRVGNPKELEEILNTDEGARYIGEFALGLNPYITKTFGETLFDEKVGGSFHFTPGNAYSTADNGNKSAEHWDIVCDQSADQGGGQIWFDDNLIRQDGIFVPDALQGLNPKNLMTA